MTRRSASMQSHGVSVYAERKFGVKNLQPRNPRNKSRPALFFVRAFCVFRGAKSFGIDWTYPRFVDAPFEKLNLANHVELGELCHFNFEDEKFVSLYKTRNLANPVELGQLCSQLRNSDSSPRILTTRARRHKEMPSGVELSFLHFVSS